MAWYADLGIYLWMLLKDWLTTIFVVPFTTLDMLWLLVPVWASWFFSEFFQEKHGTSLGNAISNAVIVLWGSIDCMRQTANLIAAGTLVGFGTISLRFLIALTIFAYGVVIVSFGIKGNPLAKRIARIREVTYVFIMLVPVFYNAVPLTFNHIMASIIYFPLFYYVVELIDYLTPDPKSIEENEKSATSEFKF